jgi:hypothetical protein
MADPPSKPHPVRVFVASKSADLFCIARAAAARQGPQGAADAAADGRQSVGGQLEFPVVRRNFFRARRVHCAHGLIHVFS